jgi:hypothetical protein
MPFLPSADSKAVCRRPRKDFGSLAHTQLSQKSLLGKNRSNLGLLLCHFTGFSRLRYPLSLMYPGLYSPECCLCGDDREESAHILRDCPALVQSRMECLWTLIVEEFWFVHGILFFLKLPKVAALEQDDIPDPRPDDDIADDPPLDMNHVMRAPSTGSNSPNAGSLFSPRRCSSARRSPSRSQ